MKTNDELLETIPPEYKQYVLVFRLRNGKPISYVTEAFYNCAYYARRERPPVKALSKTDPVAAFRLTPKTIVLNAGITDEDKERLKRAFNDFENSKNFLFSDPSTSTVMQALGLSKIKPNRDASI